MTRIRRRPRAGTPTFLAKVFTTAALLAVPSGVLAQNACSTPGVGLIPLEDMGIASYAGYEGGLYPGGASVRPVVHERAGAQNAARVVPRSPSGAAHPAGRIGLLTVGMSNTRSESDAFVTASLADASRNPAVVPVNGAEGGASAELIRDAAHPYWQRLIGRVQNAGLTPAQVQVVWIKEADQNPTQTFPGHAQKLETELGDIVRNLKSLFPNLRQCFLSSRIYAGYATTTLNPEPFAYESGFAVKWLVEAQINGDPALNQDPRRGAVVAPWLAWGPYLWADGTTPRSDGLTWSCPDFAADGTHPSAAGAAKVAALLLAFFRQDPATAGWYMAAAATDAEIVSHPSPVVGAAFPNPSSGDTRVVLNLPAPRTVRAQIYSLDGRLVRVLHDGMFPAGSGIISWDGRGATGVTAPSGIYFLRVSAGGQSFLRKLTRVD